jgi:hypothetical protein
MVKMYGTLNKWVLLPAYVATEAYEFGVAINEDSKHYSTRNLVEKGANFIGATGSGYSGWCFWLWATFCIYPASLSS